MGILLAMVGIVLMAFSFHEANKGMNAHGCWMNIVLLIGFICFLAGAALAASGL